MYASLVLGAKTTATGNLLHLLVTIPEQTHFSTDRTAITRRALELETDPFVLRRHVVFINEQRSSLIRYHHIEHATIPQINERHRAPVKNVTRAHRLRHIHKLAGAVVDPNSL